MPASVRRLYQDQKGQFDRLKALVDRRIVGLKNPRWHFESRVKELSSFALKLETGRFRNPGALEDFFACTLVVANSGQVGQAVRLIEDNFEIKDRRPPSQNSTHKRSDSFPFDDLRLYACVADRPEEPPTDLIGMVFEIQIKTFLQHAWSIATHDLLYKSDDANWSMERIAYQIKAMLEHAEISIEEAQRLASSSALAKEDRRTANLKRGIELVKSQWGTDQLPKDVRRLAGNIGDLLRALKIDLGRLETILNEKKGRSGGSHPSNLSPFSTVVQYLFETERQKMLSLLRRENSHTKVFIPDEVSLPADVAREDLRNAVFVPRPAP